MNVAYALKIAYALPICKEIIRTFHVLLKFAYAGMSAYALEIAYAKSGAYALILAYARTNASAISSAYALEIAWIYRISNLV
jgi:hypothetical protein